MYTSLISKAVATAAMKNSLSGQEKETTREREPVLIWGDTGSVFYMLSKNSIMFSWFTGKDSNAGMFVVFWVLNHNGSSMQSSWCLGSLQPSATGASRISFPNPDALHPLKIGWSLSYSRVHPFKDLFFPCRCQLVNSLWGQPGNCSCETLSPHEWC